jgi:hypothetical protein
MGYGGLCPQSIKEKVILNTLMKTMKGYKILENYWVVNLPIIYRIA